MIEGETTLRIAPNKHDLAGKSEDLKDAPFAEIRMHYGVGPDGIPQRCGKDIDGRGKCWLCDVQIPKLASSSNPSRQKMADEISPTDVLVVQVFPVQNDKFRKAQPWWISSKRLAVTVLQLLSSTRRSYIHPIKGYNVTITRTGTGMKTQYSSAIPDDGPSSVPKSALETIQEFQEVLPAYSANKQKSVFFGKEEIEMADDEDAEPLEATDADSDEEFEEVEEATDLDEEFEDEPDEEEATDPDEEFEDEPDEEPEEEPEDEPDEEFEDDPEEDDFEDEPEPEPEPRRKRRPVEKPAAKKVPVKKAPAKKAPQKAVAKKTTTKRRRK